MGAVGALLAALEGRQGVALVVEVVDPGEVLEDRAVAVFGPLAWGEVAEGLELGEQVGQGAFLEGDDEAPAVASALVEDGPASVEAVEEGDEAEAGEAGLELGGPAARRP